MIPGRGEVFIHLAPESIIHISPESLFTSLRNDYSHAPEYAASRAQSLNSAASVPGLIDFRTPRSAKNNWAPRIGLAWSPGTSGKTSIRAGFGLAYDQFY